MVRSMVEDGVRAVRLAVFSIAATVLALAAHVLAGGAPPALLATVVAIIVPGATAVALSRRRRRVLEITVTLGAVQVVLHEVFAAVPAGHGEVGHVGHVGPAPHAWMPVTHAVAVLLTAALLAHGEHVLHLLKGWWRAVPAVCRALVPAVVLPQRPSLPVEGVAAPVPTSRWDCSPLVRRGPPVPVC